MKVQYPGVAEAVRSDLQNLDMIMRMFKRMTPGMDVKAVTREITERIVDELDYELEAQNQRSLARIFAGHPFIVIPQVVSDLSRRRVMVSDFVTGVRLRGDQGSPAEGARQDRARSSSASSWAAFTATGQFSGDPHPGNFLLMEDGRVAFLDFGLFKRLDAEPVEMELAVPARRGGGQPDGAARDPRRLRVPTANPSGSTPTACSRSSGTPSGGTRRLTRTVAADVARSRRRC